MTREDYLQAIVDTLNSLDALDREREQYVRKYREARKQYLEDLARYRAKVAGEDRQMELEVRNE